MGATEAREIRLRLARQEDIPELAELIARSVAALNAGDYTADQLASARRHMYGLDTQLVADGTYVVAEAGGRVVGCGGWSNRRKLYGGDHFEAARDKSEFLDPASEPAKIRAFFVHPEWARRGIGRRLLLACEAAARAAGFKKLELMATLTGVPLYAACGFVAVEQVDSELPDGARFPLVRMVKHYNQ